MSKIQVNTNDLYNGSQSLKSASGEIANAQGKASSAADSTGNAYDGQLREAIERIVGGSSQIGERLQNRAIESGNELFTRANGFVSANEAGISAILGVTTEYNIHIQTTPILGYLSFINKIKGVPTSILNIGGVIIGGIISWIFVNNTPATVKVEYPVVPPNEQTVYKPQSPLGDYKITAHFPEYAEVKNKDGSSTRSLHTGLDIQPRDYNKNRDADKDFPIRPIGPGKIVQVGTEYKKDSKGALVLDKDGNKIIGGYGNYVVIEHTLPSGETVYSRYAHMKAPSKLKTGDIVDNNSQLGNMGSSGNSSGPHLHLEVYEKGAYTGYNGKNPNDKFNLKDPNSLTYAEKMKQEFYDPESFVNGTTEIRFVTPK